MFEDLTYEEFKGNAANIKRRIKRQLLSTTDKFDPKRKSISRSKTFGRNSKKFSRKDFLTFIETAIDKAEGEIGSSDVKIELVSDYYSSKIKFSGFRNETPEEVNDRLNKAVQREYEKISRRFARELKKETAAKKKIADAKRKELAAKRKRIKDAKKLIEDLGEDVYEVFGEIIKNS